MAITPNYSWPLPDDTSLVKDGAEAIRDLGNAIDNTVENLPSGGDGGLVPINTTTMDDVFSQSINAFSSTFDNYKIICRITANSTNGNLRLRLRNNTTDETANSYLHSGVGQNIGASLTTSNIGSGSGQEFILSNLANSLNFSSFSLDILSPFDTVNTLIMGHATGREGGSNFVRAHQGILNTSTSYNSINVFPSTGKITGIISIYGYAKA